MEASALPLAQDRASSLGRGYAGSYLLRIQGCLYKIYAQGCFLKKYILGV